MEPEYRSPPHQVMLASLSFSRGKKKTRDAKYWMQGGEGGARGPFCSRSIHCMVPLLPPERIGSFLCALLSCGGRAAIREERTR